MRSRRAPPLYERKELNELSTLLEAPFQALLDEAEERGQIDEAAIEAFAVEHDLDEDEVAALRAELDSREVEILTPAPAEEIVYEAGPTTGTADALTLFMNRAGQYQLLTAAEEVALAKRIERGDARPRSG